MKTIHKKGFAKDISVSSIMDDNYDFHFCFPFGEDGTEVIPNVFLRIYSSDKECTLDEAIEGLVKKISGELVVTGSEYGYSEYTVEGFNVSEAKLGGHDLHHIFENLKEDNKYLHILIDQLVK